MRALTISGIAALSFVAFSSIASAACFEGHNHRTASDITKPKESVTVSTHDGQVKLPVETTGEKTTPAKPAE